jgi:hypothetical protein
MQAPLRSAWSAYYLIHSNQVPVMVIAEENAISRTTKHRREGAVRLPPFPGLLLNQYPVNHPYSEGAIVALGRSVASGKSVDNGTSVDAGALAAGGLVAAGTVGNMAKPVNTGT